ncbi:hypothetical protein [Novosphingobium silvae]|uniref:hypothetical protein n=1 Tax=Novosphingobium silvae TaxID=2692619 RepID=UPI001F37ABF6|nr:hypothetical protein [Novosphingobium silvae]
MSALPLFAPDTGTAANAARTSATNASTDAGRASTFATEASSSATDARGSATSATQAAGLATTARNDAQGAASAASDSAATAASQASDAGTSASAASDAKTAAETARGLAQTSASNAATSETNAKGSESVATQQAGVATQARVDAQSAASAASTSASTATTKAGEAGASATVANNARTAAETAQGNAKTHADNAASSATTASGAATSASQSSGVATSAAHNALLTAANGPVLPSDFSEGGRYWAVNNGLPTRPSLETAPNAAYTFPTVSGVGRVAQIEGSGNRSIAPLGWIPYSAGRVVRYQVRHRVISGAANIRLYLASQTEAGGDAGSGSVIQTSTSEWQTLSTDRSAAPPAGTVYTRPVIRVEASVASVVQISLIAVFDVTSEAAASASATAAAGSANTANTKAGEAGQSATAASAARTAAETARGGAQTSASDASSAAQTAQGHAASAATQAGLAAGSATTAGEKATAASESATTAGTKATEAGTSAGAAETARANAVTARGAAESARDTAVTARNDAQGAATTATQQAQLATTARNEANGFAGAASNSATSAASSATDAGSQAEIARQHKDTAVAASGTAQGAATNAQSYATQADGSRALAASSATLASSFSTQALSKNAFFSDPAWTTQSVPPSWALWSNDGNQYIGKWAADTGNLYSGRAALRIARSANGNNGVSQVVSGIAAGWYVLEADVTSISGNWLGAGVAVTDESTPQQDPRLSFGVDPDLGGTVLAGAGARNRKFSKLIQLPLGPPNGRVTLHAMSGWSGFSTTTNAANFVWHKCLIRPATRAEIDGKDALAATVTQGATISTQGQAISTLNSDVGTLKTTVAAQGTTVSQQATAISSLSGDVGALKTTVSAQGASITSGQTALSSLETRMASAETAVTTAGNPNLLYNAGFERGDLSSWSQGGSTWGIQGNPTNTWGVYAVSNGNIANNASAYLETASVGVDGGVPYTFSADAGHFISGGTGRYYLQLLWMGADNATLISEVAGPVRTAGDNFDPTGVKRRAMAVTATAPSNARYVRCRIIWQKTSGTSTSMHVRQAKLERGSVATGYSAEASVRQSFESINGLYARAAVRLDVNGYVSGWEANNNGSQGNFIVNADSFEIRKPAGGPRTEYSNGVWRV